MIDARNLRETDGGSFGLLATAFGVRVDSKYKWLKKGLYLSFNPGLDREDPTSLSTKAATHLRLLWA